MSMERYHRQIIVKELGVKGQESLSKKHVLIIGGGGLGSNSANLLVRMGIGNITIIDHDQLEITNIHRTTIFTEEDIGKSKATILQEKLSQINSTTTIKSINQKSIALKSISYIIIFEHFRIRIKF